MPDSQPISLPTTTPGRVTLDTLKIGQEAQIERLRGGRANAQRLQEMGLIPGTTVRVLKFAPLGDPIELMLRGYHLTLRKEEASFIEVTLKQE
ncbi:MAG TPA: FeoA family protein [Acidobacteriota bacterium]|nr:FeoA family protein [Acidobacteriota bacterium]HNG93642.1 FeoA family protein [Acidobacteriota bacterium]HNH84430.1 FeoA family protein [Acidobacteriota bacterium]